MFRQKKKKKITMILTIIMYFKENSNISKRTKYKKIVFAITITDLSGL